MPDGFTDTQIANFRRYEKIRLRGGYNMLSVAAARATKLANKDYMFVLKNYRALSEAASLTPPKPS